MKGSNSIEQIKSMHTAAEEGGGNMEPKMLEEDEKEEGSLGPKS